MIETIRVTEIEAKKAGRVNVKLRVQGETELENIMWLIQAAPVMLASLKGLLSLNDYSTAEKAVKLRREAEYAISQAGDQS